MLQTLALLPLALARQHSALAQAGLPGSGGITGGNIVADGAALLRWPRDALALIVKYQLNPLRAARVLAYLQVALYTARASAAPAALDTAAAAGWLRACAHLAASEVLAYFFPGETPGRIEAQGWLRAMPAAWPEPLALALRAAARDIAEALIARARSDGAERAGDARGRPPLRAGVWQAAPPLHAQRPVESLAGQWRNWIGASVTSSADARAAAVAAVAVPPPHRPDSPAWRAELAEVLAVARALSPAQRAMAERWNLEQGSVTPGGVWLGIALDQLRAAALPETAQLHLLALLGMTMMDALVLCWRVKYTHWSERPVTAIRRELDADFMPLLLTPAFPAYVSGHATLSGAAARVLGHFFPARAAWFEAQAEEAALSRLYGGIHFRSDNEAGLALGRRVAEEALKQAMPVKEAPATAALRPAPPISTLRN